MKEYCSSEIFETPISFGVAYKGFDFGIESFAGGVGDWIHAITEKASEELRNELLGLPKLENSRKSQ